MKVYKMIVFRIVPFDSEVNVGECLQCGKWKDFGKYKQQLEDTLEKYRPEGYPQRNKCLYVCFSKENAYEWAYIKYRKKNVSYKLLTLEVEGDLFWLKSDCYNFLPDNSHPKERDKACIDYWNSNIEDAKKLVLDKGYEGLFVGDAVVKAVEYKNYVNGESKDINRVIDYYDLRNK